MAQTKAATTYSPVSMSYVIEFTKINLPFQDKNFATRFDFQVK